MSDFAKSNPTTKIPLQDFFKSPEKTAFQLSPDEAHLAFMQPWEEGDRRMNVYVLPTDNLAQEPKRITSATQRDLYGFLWVNAHTLVYACDEGGDENTHIYAISLQNPKITDLTPFPNVKAGLLDDLQDDDDHILITLNQKDPMLHDVYKLNVHNGSMQQVAENPGNISGWLTDHDGKLRVAQTTDGVETTLLFREEESHPFRPLITLDFKTTLAPLAFSACNQKLYVSSNIGRDTQALCLWDPETQTETKVLFAHPNADIARIYLSPKDHRPLACGYITDKPQHHFFDQNFADLYATLKTSFPNDTLNMGYSRHETHLIIAAHSDVHRGSYYLYHIQSATLSHLADLSPWLPKDAMASMQPIHFTARDGLEIHGYLTLPPHSTGKMLPVVVHPHGGPWARDTWGFQPEVQFLAHHGFVVLQVNFRGSTGYGRRFWEKGFKQWGLAMQDDITDAVHWLIQRSIADPERIAIYGASYGGYATLAGLCFTPDLYACGVDYVGVSNLFTFMETIPPYWKLYLTMLHEMVGHPEKDRTQLEKTSPSLQAHAITAPLFIAQGANDPRVKQSESDQMVAALKARGVEVAYMVKENEGHGFQNEENKFAFYQAMLDFLRRHLFDSKETQSASSA